MPVVITYITTALQAEARPLIDHYRLKQDTESHALRVYRSRDVILVVGGVGKIKSAIATSVLLSAHSERCGIFALNIGIAGAFDDGSGPSCEIGDFFLVNKLVDQSSGRAFFPDLLAKVSCRETLLTTVERPLDRREGITIDRGLVDMEGTGFFQAAATFVGPHQVAVLKIVSDFLEVGRFDKNWVSDLVSARLNEIDEIRDAHAVLLGEDYDSLGSSEHELLDRIRGNLRLTFTQYKILTEQARAYKLATNNPLPDLASFLSLTVTNKNDRKQHLDRICEKFLPT